MSALTLSHGESRPGWLHRPVGYVLCAPLVMVAGAATTIIAPRLLAPSSFAQFALLVSVTQYASDFDLGLARLIDRRLAGRGSQPDLMWAFMLARIGLAAVLLLVALLAVPFTGILTAVAATAGISVMLCNGSLAFFRAQSKLAAFTVWALVIQAGLSLPRLAGLLLGGVAGCILALAIWYTAIALFLSILTGRPLRQRTSMRALPLFTESIPLFVFSSSWLLFLLSNRWFAWLLTNPTETGLFAFGANLVGIATAFIAMVVQTYYPRHLAAPAPGRLFREMAWLLAFAVVGVIAGTAACRYAITTLFPHFVGAEASTAALLVAAVPLCFCAWLIPLLIARSGRPMRDAATMFGTCLAGLFACMWLGSFFGIRGLAWGCCPPTLVLLGWHLRLAVRDSFMTRQGAAAIWGATFVVSVAGGGLWWLMFHPLSA